MFKLNSFSKACLEIRESLYGFKAVSQIRSNQYNISTGSAFMIAPGIVTTAAHLLHVENNPARPRHGSFLVIRAPDVGQEMEQCVFINEDTERDVALLRINNPRSTHCVKFQPNKIIVGTNCGSLGFPLAYIDRNTGAFQLVERFQGAYISSFNTHTIQSGRQISFYETDALMYKGSSGCPGFLIDAKIYGMHNKSIIDQPEATSGDDQRQGTRLAISLWIPAADIVAFAKDNGINL